MLEPEPASNILVRVPLEADRSISRKALQSATYSVHERLHRHPGLARLAAGTIDRDEYRRLLARTYGFYAMAEPALGIPRMLTDNLAQDLITLGMTSNAVSGLPHCPLMKIDDGQAERIGAHYVLMGASLGGKVMAKAIAHHNATLPVCFLTSLGENDWKTFAADLEVNLPDAASRTRAAKAATTAFAAYEDWMAGHE